MNLKTKVIFFLVFALSQNFIHSQESSKDSSGIKGYGVAVAPSSMRFRVKPGSVEKKYLTVTNDTYKSYKFSLSFADIEMGRNGKVGQLPVGQIAEFGLSRWISASPNFIELAPGEKKKIEITLDVPDEEKSIRAGWCIGMLDEANERKKIVGNPDEKGFSMGVVPTFGFGIYFYQNPPSLDVSDVEIRDFSFSYDEESKYVHLLVKNIGKGISRSKAYIELNDLKTGYYEKMDLKVFNILPGREREFDFKLPGDLPKGHYSIMGVLDFGSEEEIKAASKEIIIK
ncbi:DUF916 domain-containing protein [Flavobacteriales bacterium]|jgi:hypothetical protein|nr:DUF916 domain-containing protein [Flavobacteriales bacterium]